MVQMQTWAVPFGTHVHMCLILWGVASWCVLCTAISYPQFLNCPRLSLGEDSVVRGVKAIHDKIKDLNEAVRGGSEVLKHKQTLLSPDLFGQLHVCRN